MHYRHLNPNELIHYVHIFLRWVQRSHAFKWQHVYDAQFLLYYFHKENPLYKQAMYLFIKTLKEEQTFFFKLLS